VPRPPRALTRAAPGLALLAVLLGCGEPEATPPPAPRAAARPTVSAIAPRLEVSRAGDGSLRVVARRAPRFRVLQELARTAGFAVSTGVGRPPARDLDLDLRGASVEQALAQVLADVPHHLHYAPSTAKGGEVALRRVTVGLLPAAPPASARRAERLPDDEIEPPSRERRPDPPSEAERLAEIERKRGSRDPSERRRAVELMRPEEELATLLEVLASDPDPSVRESAAESLAEVEGGESAFRAGEALLAATLDPHAGVAAAAIRALEDVHDVVPDPRFRARITALADHADPRVRSAASSFLEWTEDDW